MKQLEDFILENKEMFMNTEPDDGHVERFEVRLRKMHRRKRLTIAARISSIAAAGLILIASSVFVFDHYFDRDPDRLSLSDLNPEMQKVEYYYTSRIDGLSAGLDSLSGSVQEDFRKMMANEFAEMDSIHHELQIKLGTNPGDERVVNAMITYYQTKLGMMKSFINTLNQIKQSNNLKNENHESTEL